MKTQKEMLNTLVAIAVDLTAAISAEDRYQRLLAALRQVIPYDAAALFRFENDELVPVAIRGLSDEVMGRRFVCESHPRLSVICNASEPVKFPADADMPDPFDGLLKFGEPQTQNIHSCLGCALRVDGRLIGVLTADSLDPSAFDHLDTAFLSAISAIAATQLHTVNLFTALELSAKKQGELSENLMRDIRYRTGTEIIGVSKSVQHLKREIELVSRSDFTVLVSGETGVGKELVATAIHDASSRREKPMLYLNCAALPETLAESELFGHSKGAFTGANVERSGKFEIADGGTLFLDEIGELPLSIQAKLLRTIQSGEIQRVGSEQVRRVDVRLLAATNRNLEKEVEEGRFRADLFHRLNVYPIRVPPLRERKEDIQLLTGYFCERTQRRLGSFPVRFTMKALDYLADYDWPGNVRELENLISRVILKAMAKPTTDDRIIINPSDLGADIQKVTVQKEGESDERVDAIFRENRSLRDLTVEFQKRLIRYRLEENEGNWAATARSLKTHRGNLHNLAKRLGLL